jgi:hypothetical protein
VTKRMDDVIGCQIGCQDENEGPPDSGGTGDFLKEKC